MIRPFATAAGFENPLTPCCVGKSDAHMLNCGIIDSAGNPLYEVCRNVDKAVIFDGIHPTQAAWKTVVHLYANVAGFTVDGPKLTTWIRKYKI